MKIKCIDKGIISGFTEGKIYEFIKNGIVDDDNFEWECESIKDFNAHQTPKFEIIEEKEVINMKKQDLKNLDIVTLKNGDRLVLIDGDFTDLSDDNDNSISDLDDFNDDLINSSSYSKSEKYDIIKVERFNSLDIVYNRTETVKELTLSEIEDKFGCKVKIIKGDK